MGLQRFLVTAQDPQFHPQPVPTSCKDRATLRGRSELGNQTALDLDASPGRIRCLLMFADLAQCQRQPLVVVRQAGSVLGQIGMLGGQPGPERHNLRRNGHRALNVSEKA